MHLEFFCKADLFTEWLSIISAVLKKINAAIYVYSCFGDQVYNGDDYNGARIVSRAYELRDAVSFSFGSVIFWCFGLSIFIITFPPSGSWNALTDGPCTCSILWQNCSAGWSNAYSRWFRRIYFPINTCCAAWNCY